MEPESLSFNASGNRIPAPSNSFLLFSQDRRSSLEGRGTGQSQSLETMWHYESAEVRAHYQQCAKAGKRKRADEGGKKKGQKRVKTQANKQETSSSTAMFTSIGRVLGHEVGVAHSTMPLAPLPYPMIPVPSTNVASPSTVSSNSFGPATPRALSPVLPALLMPPFQSIPGASLNDATGYGVNWKGKGKERASDAVPRIYNYQAITATLSFHPGQLTFFAYNNPSTALVPGPLPAASQPVTAVDHHYPTVKTLDTSGSGATYRGAKRPIEVSEYMLLRVIRFLRQDTQVNLNKQTAGDASAYHFGSAQKAHSQPASSFSFASPSFIKNTGVSSSNARVVSYTPNATNLLANPYANCKVVAKTVSNGNPPNLNTVDTGIQGAQSHLVQPSFPTSTSIKKSKVSSPSAVKYVTPSPTELLSAHYASREASAKRVTNDATQRTSPEAAVRINSTNPSVLIANSGAATPKPAATVHSSIPLPTSLLATYNTVAQVPSSQVAKRPDNNFYGYSMEDFAAILVHNWLCWGGIKGLDAQITRLEELIKEIAKAEELSNEANVVWEAQSGATALTTQTLQPIFHNAYWGGVQNSIGGPSRVNAPYVGPASGPSFRKEFSGFNYPNVNF
ncbi:hypothetical protein C0995_015386 [Termitomyces sp. Mi166|nr:hypothetical protein C0995_015386 [Termitomyces sp. Mi166\